MHTHTALLNPHTSVHSGGNSKTSAKKRHIRLPYLLQQAAAPKTRTPAAAYTGSLRGTAGKTPEWRLLLRSSNPRWKSSKDSLQSCGSLYTSAYTEGRRDSAIPALTHTVSFEKILKFVASAVAGNGTRQKSLVPKQPSSQPTDCSLFLYLTCSFGPLPRMLLNVGEVIILTD